MQQRKAVSRKSSGSVAAPSNGKYESGKGAAAEVSSGGPVDDETRVLKDRSRRSSHPSKRQVSKARSGIESDPGYARVTLAWVLLFGAMMGMCVIGYHYLLEWETQEERLISERLHREEMDPMTKEWEEKLLELQQENVNLREASEKHATEPPRETKAESKEMIKKIGILREYKKRMHHGIQAMSRRYILEKFGPGPHRVEVQLDFDPQSTLGGSEDRFVVELAKLDLMPHAVYTFLSQVDQGLYNGCSFHRNAGHVVQGGPAPNFKSPPNAKLHKKFVDNGLESVRFQEYSKQFPHEKYTLGYAGRPGGPDFYVSTKNNTRAHGPGGQSSYADPSEADPCFAKVVEGFGAVDRMAKSPVADRDYRHMEHNIAIRYMKLLSNE